MGSYRREYFPSRQTQGVVPNTSAPARATRWSLCTAGSNIIVTLTDGSLSQALHLYNTTAGEFGLSASDHSLTAIPGAPDRNVLINHRHTSSDRITIAAVTPFIFDPRLFQP